MKRKSNYSKITGLLFTALLFALIAMPSSVFAVTAAQTVITNTATVTWTAGPPAGVSASVDVTVQLVALAPTIAYVSTSPDPVAQGQATTATYTLTSTANGLDSYTLTSSSTTNTNVGAPVSVTPIGSPLAVGASMILGVVNATTITVSGISTNNGLVNGDTVVIGGTPFTITVTDNVAANTSEIVLSAAHGAAIGDPVYERATFTVNVVAGNLVDPTAVGSHTLTTIATSVANNTLFSSENTGVVNVAPATITITKNVDDTTPLPGQIISYTIVVTNTSTSIAAAGIVIIDPIPGYTTYVAGSSTATGTGGISWSDVANLSTWVGADNVGATGVRVDYATLAALASETVTFQVTVAP